MLNFSQQNISRVCEVLAMNGDIVATGRISEANDKYIKITNSLGKMPLIDGNIFVKLLLHNQEDDTETFVGLVYQSTGEALLLTNVELLSDIEKREYFRVSVKLDTKCYIDDGSGELDEMKSFKVKVRDLSLKGAFVVTNAILESDQKVYLVLPLSETKIFSCTVKRKVEYYKSTGYGCSFEKYTNQQEDLLCQYIFDEQRKMILKAKRYD